MLYSKIHFKCIAEIKKKLLSWPIILGRWEQLQHECVHVFVYTYMRILVAQMYQHDTATQWPELIGFTQKLGQK